MTASTDTLTLGSIAADLAGIRARLGLPPRDYSRWLLEPEEPAA